MRYTKLSACCMAACSVRACASWRRWLRHGQEQHRRRDELLTGSGWHVWVVHIDVGVDTLTGLPSRLSGAFITWQGFFCDGGVQEPHLSLLLHLLCLELTGLSQLCDDVRVACQWCHCGFGSRSLGASLSPALPDPSAFLLMVTMKHSRVGS
jgi:hypothetical protein